MPRLCFMNNNEIPLQLSSVEKTLQLKRMLQIDRHLFKVDKEIAELMFGAKNVIQTANKEWVIVDSITKRAQLIPPYSQNKELAEHVISWAKAKNSTFRFRNTEEDDEIVMQWILSIKSKERPILIKRESNKKTIALSICEGMLEVKNYILDSF
jgi:hypothetical protein